MSEQDNMADVANDNPEQPAAEAKASVKKGTITVFSVIVLSLIWYLLADRFTPYTDQARVQGYVVGVAPKVAGVVTQVWVTNNKKVQEDQPLFQIDPSQYQIALLKAQSDLESARRQVDAGSATVESARANLRAALANEQKAHIEASDRNIPSNPGPGTGGGDSSQSGHPASH